MTHSIVVVQKRSTGPTPVTGAYGEVLAEVELACQRLIALVAAERSGTFDGFGANVWTVTDPLLTTAKKIVELVDRSRAELQDQRNASGG